MQRWKRSLPPAEWSRDVSVLKLANQLVSWASSCRAQNRRSGRRCWCEQVRPTSEVPSLCYRAGWHLGAFTEILARTAREDDNTRSQRCTEHSFLGQVKRRSFPGGSDGSKDSACNSVPGWGRSPGEWNANPLQYSCLENSMDRGDWRATVDGVIKSQTRLSDCTATITKRGRGAGGMVMWPMDGNTPCLWGGQCSCERNQRVDLALKRKDWEHVRKGCILELGCSWKENRTQLDIPASALVWANLSTCWQICCLMGEAHRGESGLWGQECGLWGSLGAGHRTLPFSAPRHLEPPSEAAWLPGLPSWRALWCSRPALPGTTAGCPKEEEAITEVLWGESEPLPELLFFVLWASEVPKRRVSYTGSTLLPQAATEEKAHLRQGSLKSR